MIRPYLPLLPCLALLLPGPAAALDFHFDRFGGVDLNWENQLSAGVQIRTSSPDPHLIGKAHLEQNRSLCAADDCLAFNAANSAPNARYLAAPGALGSYTDQGDLNYKAGDITQAVSKWSSDLKISLGPETGFNLSWLYFYDPVNTGFKENHPNQIVTPGPQPGVAVKVARSPQQEKYIGNGFQLRNANFYTSFDYAGDHHLDLQAGRQVLTWGEAALETQGTLNFINPFDFNDLARPGAEFKEIYQPVNMLRLQTRVNELLTVEGFYQLEWRPVILPAKGSFLSFFNAGNDVEPNEGLELPFSKTPDDPAQAERAADPIVRLVTNTSFTARRAANHTPPHMGQFGLDLHLVTEFDDHPWEFGLFAANYHSRLPFASAYASAASCARRENSITGMDATNAVELVAGCGANVPGGANPTLLQREVLPLDTAQYFLDYPKNIHIVGLTFNTVMFDTVVQGELTYRPNQPVQVSLVDTLFAAFQPAFARGDGAIPISDANTLLGVPLLTLAPVVGQVIGPQPLAYNLPESRLAVPDYVTAYRGGTPGEIAPHQYIPGYQRFGVLQPTVTLIKVLGQHSPLGADDMILLGEFGAVIVPGLPSLERLQLEGPGDYTSYGPGAADSGNALRINPISNKSGWVTRFSAGSRLGLLADYRDVWRPGLSLRPEVVVTWDFYGVAPGLGENYLQGRKIAVIDLQAAYHGFAVDLLQTFIFGGGDHNTLHDRDFAGVTLSYKF
jgi:hypothetical protein